MLEMTTDAANDLLREIESFLTSIGCDPDNFYGNLEFVDVLYSRYKELLPICEKVDGLASFHLKMIANEDRIRINLKKHIDVIGMTGYNAFAIMSNERRKRHIEKYEKNERMYKNLKRILAEIRTVDLAVAMNMPRFPAHQRCKLDQLENADVQLVFDESGMCVRYVYESAQEEHLE